MPEVKNNCSVSVTVVDGGMIETVISSDDFSIKMMQNATAAHRVACDLLNAIAQIQNNDEGKIDD